MHFLVLLSALLACAAAVPLNTTKPILDGRIVGGTPTTIENHPFQVSVHVWGRHICGASIISPNWVVTAAHCVVGVPLSAITVRSGTNFSNSGGIIHRVLRVIIHRNFNPSTLDFDVALLEVNPPFSWSTVRQRIDLVCGPTAVGTNVVVTGWGATSEGGAWSTTLRQVTVQIISDSLCNSAYAAFGGITARMICAGVPGGGRDACQGDSGGPLFGNGGLVGIVSWGVGCARPQFPGVYTRLSAVCSWIINNAV